MLVAYDEITDNGECPYLPDRQWRAHSYGVVAMSSAELRTLLEAGYRRSGHVLYQPRCIACAACRPTRILVDEFKPDRSQRRNLAHNADLSVTRGELAVSRERVRLYDAYCRERHGPESSGCSDSATYRARHVDSPVRGFELDIRDRDARLLAVALIDDAGPIWSSVYTYYDVAQSRRGLGTFAILQTLAAARAAGVKHLHLGFYVAGSRTMAYKLDFVPVERLEPDGTWRRFDRRPDRQLT